MRILIIDDYEGVAETLKEGLGELGCECTIVTTLAEGRRKFTAQDWDAVIVDVILPDGDGAELAKLIAACHVRTVLITGYSSAMEMIERGAIPCLRKPFPLSTLAAVLGLPSLSQAIVPNEAEPTVK